MLSSGTVSSIGNLENLSTVGDCLPSGGSLLINRKKTSKEDLECIVADNDNTGDQDTKLKLADTNQEFNIKQIGHQKDQSQT